MHPELDRPPAHAVHPLLFPNQDEFWLDDMRRMISAEADFGVFWRGGGTQTLHRVSYIQDTGEVYSAAETGAREVRILGIVPADPVTPRGSIWYQNLDEILRDWADLTVTGGRIEWITARLQLRGQVVGCHGCPFEYMPSSSPCRRTWVCARPDPTWLARGER